MRGSIRLGVFTGIPVYLHWTFLLLLGFVGFSGAFSTGSATAAFVSVVFVAAIFGCVVLHEFGHALAARRFGIATRDVTLLPIGGVARLERMPDDPRQELWIALAGPAVNVVIAGVLAILLFLTGGTADSSLLSRLLAVNLGLIAFNMLPAFPMDGGRVLRSLLARRLDYVRATAIAALAGRGMAVLFGVAGLFWNPMLVLIAAFVWLGAGQELHAARARRTFHDDPWRHDPPESYGGEPVIVPDVLPPDAAVRRGRFYRVGPILVYREESGSDGR